MRDQRAGDTAPERGRREHRKRITRRDLLVAGRRLFSEKGIYDARIEDLTHLAGVAKGTLYGYFADKEALIEAVVTSGFDELAGVVQRATHGATTRAERIERVAREHLVFLDENPDLMRVFHQVRGLLKFDEPHWPGLRRVFEYHLETVARQISRDGRTVTERDRAIAKLLFGAISGIASTRAATRPRESVAVDAQATAHAITAAVLAYERARSRGGRRGGR
ncbi:MAG: TetR/AcrR family transcriptional regulator [Candidatus Eisenbacteria bacterium]